MARSPQFRMDFTPAHGQAVDLGNDITRVTANNAGPYTFHGTNTYIVGKKTLAIVDPGPDNEAHYRALLGAIGGRTVEAILVTHTHIDHSMLARRLARETGAAICAEGPHRPARPLNIGETNLLDASSDREFVPDRALADRERIAGKEWQFEAVFTPGHAANHMCFALAGADILFSGDHVMAWSTTIVAPPDGAMADYMASLETLLKRRERVYLPGHGGQLDKAHEFVRALRAHRRMREAAILARLKAGDRTIAEIVAAVYRDLDPRLHGAAALSVLAHIEDLLAAGRIASDGPASLTATYEAADAG